MIIYLHGFRSSPFSTKAQQLAARMSELGRGDDFVCPALSVEPRSAAARIDALVKGIPPDNICLVGSSLGGYYATWLAEKIGCRAVLLNPAIRPDLDLTKHLGIQPVFHSDEVVEVKAEYLPQLKVLFVPKISLEERYFLIAATGDEVIDWRDMVGKYPGVRTRIVVGSDHGLSDFPAYIDEVLEFARVEQSA